MRRFLTFALLLLVSISAFSQSSQTYNAYVIKGETRIVEGSYEAALECFQKAKELATTKAQLAAVCDKIDYCESEIARQRRIAYEEESLSNARSLTNIFAITKFHIYASSRYYTDAEVFNDNIDADDVIRLRIAVDYECGYRMDLPLNLRYKIYYPDGTLFSNDGRADSKFTYSASEIFSPGVGKKKTLLFWTNYIYPSGLYKFEVWYNGGLFAQKYFTLL